MNGALSINVILVGVDTGGTFTDIFASNGQVVKVVSTPHDPAVAIMRGLGNTGLGPGDRVAHGTTVATNAVLERKGARTALVTTAGFEDVLAIRRQNRPAPYDLTARWPEPLVPGALRLGVVERLDYEGQVLEPLDRQQALELADRIAVAQVESVAVCLLFSYVNPEHERAVEQILHARLSETVPLSLSHQIAPRYGEYERTSTTVVNAYVMPVIRRYLHAFERELQTFGARQLHIMNSNGGLVSARTAVERPVQTILSGPAAGVIGARAVARAAGHDQLITFDMGGTSTDVALVPGEVLERGEGEVASFPLLVPMLTIETVGAGGGSIARIDAGGGLHVGPESAGADPGPAAYGKGTQPTVTDANLVLGRLSPRGLLAGTLPLDRDRARQALQSLAGPLGLSVEQAAWAVVRLANSNMERAVRAVTLQRGYDPRRFMLVAFGGAGPLHAAELAQGLGISRVLIPPHPGVMAALGLTVPDLQQDFQQTILLTLTDETQPVLERAIGELESRAQDALAREAQQGFGEPALHTWVEARYVGQSFELRLPYSAEPGGLREAFHRAHQERYGYSAQEQPVEVVHLRVRAAAPSLMEPRLVPTWPEPPRAAVGAYCTRPEREVWFGSPVRVSDLSPVAAGVLWRPSLPAGQTIEGPAIVEQYDSTILIPPDWIAAVDERFNLSMSRKP